MRKYAPVLIIVYTRQHTLRRCVEALLENAEAPETDLFIVSDGAARKEDEGRVAAVRRYMHSISGFKAVHLVEHESNMGMGRSAEATIQQVMEEYGRIIVMEDDILPSKYYLAYMNCGLNAYCDVPEIYSICAFKDKFKLPNNYCNDAYALPRFAPWGTGFWWKKSKNAPSLFGERDRYSELEQEHQDLFKWCIDHDSFFLKMLKEDSEGKIRAFDVRREYEVMTRGWLCVFPRQTMAVPMDTSGDAAHAGFRMMVDEKLAATPVKDLGKIPLEVNREIYRRFLKARSPGRIRLFVGSVRRNGLPRTLRESFHWLFARLKG